MKKYTSDPSNPIWGSRAKNWAAGGTCNGAYIKSRLNKIETEMTEVRNDTVTWSISHPCSTWSRSYSVDPEIDR